MSLTIDCLGENNIPVLTNHIEQLQNANSFFTDDSDGDYSAEAGSNDDMEDAWSPKKKGGTPKAAKANASKKLFSTPKTTRTKDSSRVSRGRNGEWRQCAYTEGATLLFHSKMQTRYL